MSDLCSSPLGRSSLKWIWRVIAGLLLVALVAASQSAQGARQAPADPSTLLTWSQVNTNSFGFSGHDTAWSLAVFVGDLFAGTRNQNGARVWQRNGDSTSWSDRSPLSWVYDPSNTAVPTMHTFANGPLYAGTKNAGGSEVWEFNGTDWTYLNIDGFDDPDNTAVMTMSDWEGDLVAGTANSVDGTGIFRYHSNVWTQINIPGFGDFHNDNAPSMVKLTGLGMVVGTWNWNTGAEVWAYDGANWGYLSKNGFGDGDNAGTRSMSVFNDTLYVGTWNAADGAEVWRYLPPSTWQKVEGGGFDDTNNIGVSVLYPFAGYLYAGTENNVTGAEIWRTSNGQDWEMVMSGGFGDANNQEIPSMIALSHWLFAGTRNFSTGAEVWRSLPLGENYTFQVSSTSAYGAGGPDLAYNSNQDEYLAAWGFWLHGFVGVSARRFTAEGQLLGSEISIVGDNAGLPQVAFDTNLGDRYLAAWQDGFPYGTSIRAQLLNANGGKIGGIVTLKTGVCVLLDGLIFSPVKKNYVLLYSLCDNPPLQVFGLTVMTLTQAGNVAHDNIIVRALDYNKEIFGADLAWNHAHNEVLVVWSSWEGTGTNRVSGRIVELATPDVLGPAFVISGDHAGYEDTFPSVAAMGGEPAGIGTYLVTWESLDDNPNVFDMHFIVGRRVDGNGNFIGSTFSISSPPAEQTGAHTASNESTRNFFTAYQTDYRYYLPYDSRYSVSHGRSLPGYALNVSAERWIAGGNFNYAFCTSLVGGGKGVFIAACDHLPPYVGRTQVWARLIRLPIPIYLPFVKK